MKPAVFKPAVLLLLVVVQLAYAQDFSNLVPDSFAVEAAQDHERTYSNRFKLALQVSGADQNDITEYLEKAKDLLNQYRAQAVSSDPETAGENLLNILHQSLFTSYSERQTKINVLLDTGTYNCVSSAVVYMLIAEEAGLETQGVIVPDHAFCSIVTADGVIDVETTTVHGFNPGQKNEFTDAFGNITGFSYVPPGNYSKREITGLYRMIGLIYQNRIALLQRRGDHVTPVKLAVNRYALDPASRKELEIVFSNYIAGLINSGEYEEALSWILEAEKAYHTDDLFDNSRSVLSYNLILEAMNNGTADQVDHVMQQYSRYLNPGEAAVLNALREEENLKAAIETLPFDQALRLVQDSLDRGAIEQQRGIALLVYLYSLEVNRQWAAGEFVSAYTLVRDADQNLRRNSDFRTLLRTASENAVVYFHNRAAALVAEKRYEEALNLVQEGLSLIPTSAVLIKDRNIIQSALP